MDSYDKAFVWGWICICVIVVTFIIAGAYASTHKSSYEQCADACRFGDMKSFDGVNCLCND